MSSQPYRLRSWLKRVAFALVFLFIAPPLPTQHASAGIVGYLSETRAGAGETFEVDLFFAAMVDEIGNDMEFINLDIVNSSVEGVALADFTRVMFEGTGIYADWQGLEQFGRTPGFESQVSLDAFSPGALPITLVDTSPMLIGTITFNYGGLGLGLGDSVTIDVRGIDDGTASRTTSVSLFDPTTAVAALRDPDFSTAMGPGFRTFIITPAIMVPEPSSGVMILVAGIALSNVRRRHKVA